MKVIFRSLDTSSLLNIDFFEMRKHQLRPDIHPHKSDVYFDLYVEGVKYITICESNDGQDITYELYPRDMDIVPFTLKTPYGTEIFLFKEV